MAEPTIVQVLLFVLNLCWCHCPKTHRTFFVSNFFVVVLTYISWEYHYLWLTVVIVSINKIKKTIQTPGRPPKPLPPDLIFYQYDQNVYL